MFFITFFLKKRKNHFLQTIRKRVSHLLNYSNFFQTIPNCSKSFYILLHNHQKFQNPRTFLPSRPFPKKERSFLGEKTSKSFETIFFVFLNAFSKDLFSFKIFCIFCSYSIILHLILFFLLFHLKIHKNNNQ